MKTQFKNGLIAATIAVGSLFSTAGSAAVSLTNDFGAFDFLTGGDYVETTTYGDLYSSITSFTPVGGPTITLSSPAEVRQIGAGWATWCCGYTGQVLYEAAAQSVTWSFGGSGLDAFGVYAEPNPFAVYSMSLTLTDGSILTQDVDGSGGARFFGFVGTGVSSMTVSIAGSVDFALGDVFTSAVPEPEIYAMMAAGLGLMGFVARRRQRNGAVA